MSLGEAAKLFSANFVWRVTGAKGAGRTLIRGLASKDENNRLIAGMLLTRGGIKAVPLFQESLAAGAPLPLLLRVIGDSGATELEPELEKYLSNPDPHIARAAYDALHLLRMTPR